MSSEPDPQPSLIDDLSGVVSLARGGGRAAPVRVETALLDWWGRISPAAGGEGVMEIVGDLVLRETGELSVSIGDGVSDRLEVTGSATLLGVVRVELADGFAPTGGERYEVVTAAGVLDAGALSVAWEGLPDGLGVALDRSVGGSVSVEVVPVCPGDADGDGLVGLGDLLAVLAGFGDPAAGGIADGDFDGSGVVDLPDLLVVLGEFGEACAGVRAAG